MTPTDLDHLERLALEATPGPWRECASEVLIGDHWWRPAEHAHYRNESDARYIAACSPERIRALVAVAKAAAVLDDCNCREGICSRHCAQTETQHALEAALAALEALP